MAGFVVSLVGVLFTCGLLAPVGLLFSLIAARRRPRGLATAGVVIGLAGTLWVVLGAMAVAAGISSAKEARKTSHTMSALQEAAAIVESHRQPDGALPEDRQAQMLVVDLTDGHGNAMHYQALPDGRYEIRSAGGDAIFHTLDDVRVVGRR